MEDDLLVAVNNFRQRHGLNKLSRSRASGAELHAQTQANRNQLYHPSNIQGGWAENVAFNHGHNDPVGTCIEGWINSSGHRNNMLRRNVTLAGVGVARARSGAYYFALRLR